MSDTEISNLLDAMTNSILDEQGDINRLIAQYKAPPAEVAGMVDLIESLKSVLNVQQPADDFVRGLKHELVENKERVLNRILPVRVQIAAGVALLAGFTLIFRRRLLDEEPPAEVEIPALQQ